MSRRFELTHHYGEFLDFDATTEVDEISRVTIVMQKNPYAYVLMSNGHTRNMTVSEAVRLLLEEIKVEQRDAE